MDTREIDPKVTYRGPKAEFATLTGSPLWGMSVEQVRAATEERGWRLAYEGRPDTIYGKGPLVQSFTNAAGTRSFIRIPSYGGVSGEDGSQRRGMEKVFWILWQAGVKVLIVGGTSGSADWRPGEEAVKAGDVVLPWSFRTSRLHRGLFGTEHETSWPRTDLLLGAPFCTEIQEIMAPMVSRYVEQGLIRRLHTPKDTRVALVVPDGITFETDFDIYMWVAICQTISAWQADRPPVTTLHGDCVNPVLARLLGMHVAYYHMVSNAAQGMPGEDIADELYRLYLTNFPKVALDFELNLLGRLAVPRGDSCRCLTDRRSAPEVFSRAMTQPET